MRTIFTISKSSNHFFFVQNLSGWHFSSRESYNKQWLLDGGPLNADESKALALLGNVLKKYEFHDTGCPEASKEDAQIINTILNVMEPRFDKLWQKEKVKLEVSREKIEKAFLKNKEVIISNLERLFEGTQKVNHMEVSLLLSTGKYGGGGGANSGPNKVTLECSSLEQQYINNKLAILWHEITHIYLETFTDKTIDIMLLNYKETKNDLKELVTYSVFTDMSYLTSKYFPTEIGNMLTRAVEQNNYDWLNTAYCGKYPMVIIYDIGLFIKNMAEAILNSIEKLKGYKILN